MNDNPWMLQYLQSLRRLGLASVYVRHQLVSRHPVRSLSTAALENATHHHDHAQEIVGDTVVLPHLPLYSDARPSKGFVSLIDYGDKPSLYAPNAPKPPAPLLLMCINGASGVANTAALMRSLSGVKDPLKIYHAALRIVCKRRDLELGEIDRYIF